MLAQKLNESMVVPPPWILIHSIRAKRSLTRKGKAPWKREVMMNTYEIVKDACDFFRSNKRHPHPRSQSRMAQVTLYVGSACSTEKEI
jgi:hypothetical protein